MAKSSKQTIHIETEYNTFDFEGYLCELSGNSLIPTTRKNQIKERNFFNCHKQVNFNILIKKQLNLFKFRQTLRLFMIQYFK